MSQGVPIFGVWNKPNAEETGFTGNFDMARQVRRDKPYMDHIRTQQAMDPQLPKRPATSSGISERMRNEGEIWETQSAKDPTDDFVPHIMKSRRPPRPIERTHDLPPTNHHNNIGKIVKNERSEFPVRYDKGEIWETQSAGDPSENFVPQIRQNRKPTVPIKTRHDFSHTEQRNRIGEIMRNEKSQFPAGYDKGEIWETKSDRSPENFVPLIRQNRKPPIPIERRHELPQIKQHDIIGERMMNEKSQFPIGYDRGEIWETESDRSPLENFVPQVRKSQRPTVLNERRRHDMSSAKPQNILTGQDDPRGRHERPTTGTSSGSAVALIIPPEARHHRLPSSSSNGSRRVLLSSGEEEFLAEETNAMHRKPKGPTVSTFGIWNIDPKRPQEYTMEFVDIRKRMENRVVKQLENPTPQVQPPPRPPPLMQQKYDMETHHQKQKKGKQTSCFCFLFPKVKRL